MGRGRDVYRLELEVSGQRTAASIAFQNAVLLPALTLCVATLALWSAFSSPRDAGAAVLSGFLFLLTECVAYVLFRRWNRRVVVTRDRLTAYNDERIFRAPRADISKIEICQRILRWQPPKWMPFVFLANGTGFWLEAMSAFGDRTLGELQRGVRGILWRLDLAQAGLECRAVDPLASHLVKPAPVATPERWGGVLAWASPVILPAKTLLLAGALYAICASHAVIAASAAGGFLMIGSVADRYFLRHILAENKLLRAHASPLTAQG